MKLQMIFGMEMRALPSKEKVSVRDRRGEFSRFLVGRFAGVLFDGYVHLGRV